MDLQCARGGKVHALLYAAREGAGQGTGCRAWA